MMHAVTWTAQISLAGLTAETIEALNAAAKDATTTAARNACQQGQPDSSVVVANAVAGVGASACLQEPSVGHKSTDNTTAAAVSSGVSANDSELQNVFSKTGQAKGASPSPSCGRHSLDCVSLKATTPRGTCLAAAMMKMKEQQERQRGAPCALQVCGSDGWMDGGGKGMLGLIRLCVR